MCNLKTEGTKYGCGHYVITRKVLKYDCDDSRCIHSARHRRPCPDCTRCNRFLGPDREEIVTKLLPDEYCDHCTYWYKNKGRP